MEVRRDLAVVEAVDGQLDLVLFQALLDPTLAIDGDRMLRAQRRLLEIVPAAPV